MNTAYAPTLGSAIRAFATAAGSIRVEWAYNTINPSPIPTGFHVYGGNGERPATAARATRWLGFRVLRNLALTFRNLRK